mmetsp:Transcript_30922/g.50023  ORF Transcript_30922/g.50023 Transcript_30922/m.50023 type:complete len:258 (-) Transcript_30922:28-801(-)
MDVLLLSSDVIGWIYFFAWSISFYPQVILNWQAKSVVGLSFDFLFLNITGHSSYMIFNITHYARCPDKNTCNVKINDLVFSVHAVLLTAITIFQTLIYERGKQKVTFIVSVIVGLLWLSIAIGGATVAADVWSWLSFTIFLGYVKMFCSLVKYIPQAWLNFKRKSTEGWSIINIILDLTGSVLSELQMVLDSLRVGHWNVFTDNIPKTGLGIESLAFDVLFVLQHYVFYRGSSKAKGYGHLADEESSLIGGGIKNHS